MPDRPVVARAALHFWEEPPLSGTRGAGTVFFSGCSLGCVFCQNEAIAEKLKGVMVKIPAKAGTGGRLFGAVTSKEISEALQAQFDLTIAKSKIVQEEPIKSFGTYQLKCKLGYEIIGTVNVVVTEEA